MHRYLENIIAGRIDRVRRDSAALPAEVLRKSLKAVKRPDDPVPAVREAGGFVIAEIKRASPSAGLIAEEVDVGERAAAYERGGAGAVSVLCEPEFFRGSRADLRAAVSAVRVPVLCKDFVLDPYQLLEAAVDGAGWVLLIARILGPVLGDMVRESFALGLEPLVEAHTEDDMFLAVDSGARLVGINARDLDTFEVDLEVPARLASMCPAHCACIAESGIRSVEDMLCLRRAGADGFLVGEALMRQGDPSKVLKAFKDALAREAGGRKAV